MKTEDFDGLIGQEFNGRQVVRNDSRQPLWSWIVWVLGMVLLAFIVAMAQGCIPPVNGETRVLHFAEKEAREIKATHTSNPRPFHLGGPLPPVDVLNYFTAYMREIREGLSNDARWFRCDHGWFVFCQGVGVRDLMPIVAPEVQWSYYIGDDGKVMRTAMHES